MSSTFKHLPLLAACFLGSCMVGPDFRTPTNDLPATWEQAPPQFGQRFAFLVEYLWRPPAQPPGLHLPQQQSGHEGGFAPHPGGQGKAPRLPGIPASLRRRQRRVEPVPGQRFSQLHFPELLPGRVHLLGAGPLWRQPAVHRSLPRLPHVHRSFRRGRAHSPAGGRRHGLL